MLRWDTSLTLFHSTADTHPVFVLFSPVLVMAHTLHFYRHTEWLTPFIVYQVYVKMPVTQRKTVVTINLLFFYSLCCGWHGESHTSSSDKKRCGRSSKPTNCMSNATNDTSRQQDAPGWRSRSGGEIGWSTSPWWSSWRCIWRVSRRGPNGCN